MRPCVRASVRPSVRSCVRASVRAFVRASVLLFTRVCTSAMRLWSLHVPYRCPHLADVVVPALLTPTGYKGLYRGTVPTIQRAAILTATQLGTYDHVKHFILDLGVLEEGAALHFSSGTVAGFAVATTTSPVDTIRTRLFNQPLDANGKGTLYKSISDCLIKTVKSEGVLAIYKGSWDPTTAAGRRPPAAHRPPPTAPCGFHCYHRNQSTSILPWKIGW